MKKIKLGPSTQVCPLPVLLVGANVNNKPNFMAVAWGGIAGGTPPMISMAIRHNRHTMLGIQQNMTFSVNIPSVDLVSEADYCGIVSGARVDKADVCRFKIFYGKLDTAPLIEECPINMECRVAHILSLGLHFLVVGSIEETHVSENCLTEGKPDIDKLRPLAYVEAPEKQYHSLGGVVARALYAGKALKEEK
jgi:flavin reductase (DIM6/NTAB) family NADH-FMN oxidoreductase RutF